MEALAPNKLSPRSEPMHGATRTRLMLAVVENGALTPVACWPDGQDATPGMLACANTAMARRRACTAPKSPRSRIQDRLQNRIRNTVAYPLILEDSLLGVVTMEIESHAEAEQLTHIQLLEWSTGWLRPLIEQQATARMGKLVTALELVSLSLEQTHFSAAATAVANDIATRLGCTRASLGFLQGDHVRVSALSHNARINDKTNLSRDLAEIMEEAIDQDAILALPGGDTDHRYVTRAHDAFLEQHKSGAICTIPLVNDGDMIGALTLERPADRPFDKQTLELCHQVAILLGPSLELRRRDDRWLIAKAGEAMRLQLRKLLGPRHAILKLVVATLIAVTGFFMVADGTHRVTADAALEGRVQRAVVAPIDGFIATSGIRAGDIVTQGQLLGELDDKDLRLEQQKLTSQKAQYSREYRNALAERDRAQVSILSAQKAQASAQLSLIEEQLERMRIVAPFGGVVVSGDLSQSLGSPVERGDVLFQVAPLEEYRLVLNIQESDITAITVGQTGQLRLSGMPGESLPFSIEKITPVSETQEGRNVFRVEARLDSASERLRPGMEGVGKVDIGERKLIWIWTHQLIDWLRLWTWSWWP